MAELGQTTDPHALVPGRVEAIVDAVHRLRDYGDCLCQAGEGLRRIDTRDGWSGAASDAFHAAYEGQPQRWVIAGDAFERAAAALDIYAYALQAAQARARDAISRYSAADALSAAAVRQHGAAVAEVTARRAAGEVVADVPAFVDPGEPERQAARELLEAARESVRSAGDTALDAVAAERDKAPEEPSFLEKLGDALVEFGGDALRALGNLGIEIVNALASYGNAMIHHPGETAAMLGGLLLTAAGVGGEGGGLVLDATGVGAIAGVPINIASAGMIVAGVGVTAAAAGSLAAHAAGDDRVEVMNRIEEPAGPGSSGRSGSTKTDRLKEHLTDRDLDAARRELDGEVVARKADGTPWNHVQEVREAQNGLLNRIAQLKKTLGDLRLSDAARAEAQRELSEASRLLDYSKQFVPRP